MWCSPVSGLLRLSTSSQAASSLTMDKFLVSPTTRGDGAWMELRWGAFATGPGQGALLYRPQGCPYGTLWGVK
ncbi:hypothetical protein LXA43DRAFT_1012410 [Ganoderma leucocontextum]|nr:hypothetical protein LXA43DRAFT_1012410 [Ganoderma leucocontextum]